MDVVTLKHWFYYLSKYCGLFFLSRLFFKKRLRILCYHGFSLVDEDKFVPGLFLRPEVLPKRLEYLTESKFNVITLDEAVTALQEKNLPDDAVVITIDDGFFSVLEAAADTFLKYKMPSTLYLTSYYFDRDCPIFTLAVDYMFWKTTSNKLKVGQLNVDLDFPAEITIPSPAADKFKFELKAHGQALATSEEREALLVSLGRCLGIDYAQLNNSRILNLINKSELKGLLHKGMDIQLHTHRHNLPESHDAAVYELKKNKEKVNPLLSSPMTHFCYPSGVWSKAHWPALEEEGVVSATTCDPRLATYNTPLYGLPRILDSSRVSQIEFEAEMSGYNELIRFFRKS